MPPLIYNGIVTSIGKMSKTITVTVTRQLEHKKFKAFFPRATKFLVHDEDHLAHLNDKVSIVHGITYSNRKHFRLHSINRKGKSPEEYPKAEEWLALEGKLRESQEKDRAILEAKERRRKGRDEQREKRIRAAIESSMGQPVPSASEGQAATS